MKKIVLSLISLLLPMMASALAFTVDGLSYEHLGGLNDGVRLLGFVGDKCPSEITIPATVTNDNKTYSVEVISSGAFLGSTELTSVKMESQNKNGVKYIEPNSFAGCTNLSKVTFSGLLESILAPGFSGQMGAFEGCTALETIILPASMDYKGEVDATAPHNICRWAFKNCTGLKTVVIKAKSPYIEDEAFINCSSLQYFVSYNTEPWNLDNNTFQGIPSSATLIVPDGTKSKYQALSGWNAFNNIKEHSDVDLNAIIGGNDQPQGGGTAKLTIEDFTIKAGETQTMLVDMQNPDDQVTLVQFDLRLPDGLSIATGDDAIDIAGRTTWKKHTLTSNAINGITRILLYSATNEVIEGTSGAIISIKLTANSSFNGGDIKLENQLMTTPSLVESKPATYTYNIKGGGDNPPVGDAEPYVVYNDGTLTFYCDNQRSSRQGTVYELDKFIWNVNAKNITTVVFDASFANARPTSTACWFMGCENLTGIQGLGYLNTSEVTTMTMMFYGCSSLASLDVSNFNTANVTSMGLMFDWCSSLTSLDVSSFNTANVTYIEYMFSECQRLSKLTLGSSFVTTEELKCEGMFANCNSLNTVTFTGDIPSSINSKFFEGVGTADAPATLEVPDQYRDHYAVKFDGNMFFGGYFKLSGDIPVQAPLEITCKVLNAKDGIVYYSAPYIKMTWKNISNKDFNGTVWHSIHKQLENGEWFNNWRGSGSPIGWTLMPGESLWQGSEYPLEDGFYKVEWGYEEENGNKVSIGSTIIEVRGNDCYRAIWLDSDIDNGTMKSFCDEDNLDFSHTEGLKAYIATAFNSATSEVQMQQISNAVGGTGMLLVGQPGCYLAERSASASTYSSNMLVGVLGETKQIKPIENGYVNYKYNTFNKNNIEKFIIVSGNGSYIRSNEAYLRVPTQEAGDIQTVTPVFDEPTIGSEAYAVYNDFTLTFYCDDQRSKRSGTIYSLNEGAKEPEWVFDNNNRNVEKVVFDASFAKARPTTTYSWFQNCDILREIEGIENLNTSEVKNMHTMFAFCKKLESVDVSHFDTRKVVDMGAMFSNCKSLKSIDLSHFDTSSLWMMMSMFFNCNSLTEINLSSFNTSKVEYMDYLFNGCSNLKALYFGSEFTSTNNVSCEEAFADCSNLSKVVFTGDIPASINSTFFEGVGTADNPATLEVPDAYKANYQAKFNGNMFYGGYFTLMGVTGISDCVGDRQPFDVYSLSGTLVKKGVQSLKSLSKGVYIVNGRKVVIK